MGAVVAYTVVAAVLLHTGCHRTGQRHMCTLAVRSPYFDTQNTRILRIMRIGVSDTYWAYHYVLGEAHPQQRFEKSHRNPHTDARDTVLSIERGWSQYGKYEQNTENTRISRIARIRVFLG